VLDDVDVVEVVLEDVEVVEELVDVVDEDVEVDVVEELVEVVEVVLEDVEVVEELVEELVEDVEVVVALVTSNVPLEVNVWMVFSPEVVIVPPVAVRESVV